MSHKYKYSFDYTCIDKYTIGYYISEQSGTR